MKLTAEIIRQLLDCDKSTGELRWRERYAHMLDDGVNKTAERKCREWNKKWSGKVAGSFHKSSGYWQIKIFKNYYPAHRIIWLHVTGEWPRQQIDHINGDRRDNRWINLRDVSNAENGKNQSIHSDNSSGYPGVTWSKTRRKWKAQIGVNGDLKYLGCFQNIEEAAAAYAASATEHGFTDRHIFGNAS